MCYNEHIVSCGSLGKTKAVKKICEVIIMTFRIEADSIGTKQVPSEAYYGVQSLRGYENFRITGQSLRPEFINSLAQIKKACAICNHRVGELDEKIKDVIGKGGKVIQKICAECEVQIDIEDDGSVFISGLDANNLNKAYHIIKTIVDDPEIGAIYKGVVTRLMSFGAFVEIAPGKEGMVHISKLDEKRVAKVEDVVNVGDEILVMVTEIDDQNRINLSRKDAIAKINAKKEANN